MRLWVFFHLGTFHFMLTFKFTGKLFSLHFMFNLKSSSCYFSFSSVSCWPNCCFFNWNLFSSTCVNWDDRNEDEDDKRRREINFPLVENKDREGEKKVLIPILQSKWTEFFSLSTDSNSLGMNPFHSESRA